MPSIKKKIYIIGPAHPYRGGIAAFSERLAQAFQEKENIIKIHTFSYQYPDFLFPGKTQYSDDAAPANLNIQQSIHSINPFNWWKIGQQIRKEKPDFVVFQFWLPFMSPCLGSIAHLIRRNKHTQIIAVTHNVIPHEKRIGDRQLTQYFLNACDGFIAMSRSVLDDLKQFIAKPNAVYIPHPVYDNFGGKAKKEEGRAFLKIKKEEKVLLFFGLVRKYKGLDLLLEAMADAKIKEQNIKLVIAGEYYEDPTFYQNLIKKHELTNNIIAHPKFIPTEEVKYYFAAADMVVQPYRTATQSGISQMAYHFERPMLVTKVGGLPEIVPDGVVGYVVETNPQSITNAIIDFYNKDKEAIFTENVAEEKKRFSWEAMAEGIVNLTLT